MTRHYLLAVPCLLFCATLWAQDAELSGLVKDPSEAVIPGAQLKVRNVDTGYERSTLSNGSGAYDFSALRPATYEVEVSKPGFQTLVRSNLKLEVAQRARVDFTLKLGQTGQTLDVTAAPAGVDLASSTVMGVADAATTRGLPLNGRDWTQLATLQPGVASIRTQQPLGLNRGNRGYGAQVSITGGRPFQNTYRLDGIIQNDYANSTPGSVLGLALGAESVEEFSILTSGYSAQYGMTSGGVITAITRSGSNALHGSAYEFLRNNQLDARNFFDAQKPPFRRNQFGASAGGPVWKNHTFFFANYEGLRQSLGVTNLDVVPSQNARNGQLAAGTVAVSPVIKPFLALWPLPNAGLLGNGDTGLFVFPTSSVSNEDFVTTRVDHTFSARDSLYVTYLYDKAGNAGPDALNITSLVNATRRQTGALQESHVFGPRLLNTARAGFNRVAAHVLEQQPGASPLGSDASLGAIAGRAAPFLVVPPLTTFSGGVGSQATSTFGFTTYQFFDDLALEKGNHSLKFGANGMRFQDNFQYEVRPNGQFSFNSLSDFLTNKPLSFLSDLYSSPAVAVTPHAPHGARQTVVGAYVQDDFRASRSLVLNLGLRYEMATTPGEVQNKLVSLATPGSTTLRVGGPLFSNPTLRNFEPRVGFAWDPFRNGKTLLRSSFGMYDVLPLIYQYSKLEDVAPFFLTGTLSPAPAGAFPTGAYPLLTADPSKLPLSVAWVNPNPRRAYVMQWNFNIQQALRPDLTATVAYTGSRGEHLPYTQGDANIVLSTATAQGYLWPSPAGSGTKVNTKWGGIGFLDYANNSYYEGLSIKIQKRLSHGFQLQGSYTWSRSIDEGSSEIAGDSFLNSIGNLFWFNLKLNRALSDFHIGRNFVVNGLWDVPGPRTGSRLARAALSGWQLTGIFQASDGLPLTPILAGDPLGERNSVPYDLPNRLPCANMTNPRNPKAYLNTACFSFPVPSTLLGNSGRNIVIGPGLENLDFSALKAFAISERLRAQFRAEFFNLLNRANFGLPSNGIFNAAGAPLGTAGLITSTATTSRQIQFGLKLIW
jgi:hypothetical protein